MSLQYALKKSKNLYSYPLYYEIAFCKEDTRAEIDFITKCYQKHRRGSGLSSILDNGCGTGHYLAEFAKSGIEVCGYDIAPEMVRYAKTRLGKITSRFNVFEGDMRDFTTICKYDMAICMHGSFQHLITVEDVLRHLRCAANALKDGGLYLVSLPAPEAFYLYPPGSIKAKRTEYCDGITVDVNFTYRQTAIVWATQTFSGLAKFKVNDQGRKVFLEMPYCYRIFYPQEINALLRLNGCFEIVHVYPDFHIARTYGKSRQASIMNLLLRKKNGHA